MADDWGNDPIVGPAPRTRRAASGWDADPIVTPAGAPSATPAMPLAPTGQVHDGDTFRLNNGRNARLYGVDAFELDQQGRSPTGAPVPLGQQARAAMIPFAKPGATVTPTGAMTYGRPVASLTNNGQDAGRALLDQGLGLTIPQYLRADGPRFIDYTQAERLARLNRRGAFANTFQTPTSYRHGAPAPWAAPQAGTEGNSDAVFWDDPTPFQGLKPDVAKGYAAVFQDMRSTPADLLAFAKNNGFELDPATVTAAYAQRAKAGQGGGDVSYVAKPRVLTNPGDGRTGAAVRGLADPVNMLDELGALADTFGGTSGRENLFNSNRRFGDIYANNLDQNRSILDYDEATHPYYRMGGQFASGLFAPGVSAEGVGFNAARAALRSGASRFAAEQAARNAFLTRLGVSGAVEGGLAGAGGGEDAQSRLLGGIAGAPVGAALSVGAGVLAPKVASIVGKPFSRLMGRSGERAAGDFADGGVDAARAMASNDLAPSPRATGNDVTPAEVAMASETPSPSLYGPSFTDTPRTPDRIDVTQPRPLTTPYTDADRIAAARRVLSGDVLPLPSNTVDGLDEAMRANAGRYSAVKAPDERAALDTRTVYHARTDNPVKVKGPLDLVSWLRANGGVKDQGGNLSAMGVTNAPRRGLDFAGNGDRVGPIINPDGMNLDDAAFHAWEAGYFPGHAERPSINDLLGAIGDTHSGNNRSFRLEDQPEVEAFNSARQARYDTEKAAQEGAPLTNDHGQPVGMADLDANRPPMEAYHEWGENAPNLAGNIRLDKLNSPQAIKRALTQTENVTGGFDAARRGRITHAETANLASDLGMTADDLLKRRKGEAFNAEQALAARQILARSATDLVNIAKRIKASDNPGDELEAAFRERWLRHAAIQEQVSGMTAEAGRLLSQFRAVADSGATDRVLPTLAGIGGNPARIKDIAEKIVTLERDGTTPAGVNKFALRSLLPQWKDRATELYINSLLSGPQTHAANVLSNTLTALGQLPEHAVAAGVGVVRRALPGQADTDRVLFSELGSRAVGLISGAKEGMREAARAIRTDDAADAAKVEQTPAIPGFAGRVIRTPTRMLTAEDELFKGMARRMELHGLAIRQANAEGLSGRAAKDRAADLVLNPTDDMLSKANDYARYVTFQTPLESGSIGANVSKAAQKRPLLKLLVPFVRTPMNLLKFAAERSPAAPLMQSWRREVEAGGARRDLAIARALVGTGVGAAIYQMAAAGQITGGGPSDPRERAMMLANGWQPYSLKVGDRYYSYARLDPFAATIGTAADLHELSSEMTDEEHGGAFTKLAASILSNLASKTWLSGISTAVEALNDPNRNLQNFLARTAGGIAVPAIVAQTARVYDPILREARGPIDRIRSRVPGLSDDLFPRRDVLGDPMRAGGSFGPDIISPIYTSTARHDPILDPLLAAGVGISPPERSYKVGHKSVKWTPAQYDQLQSITGQLARPKLAEIVGAPGWSAMSAEQQQGAVDTAMKNARAGARQQVRSGMFGAPMLRDVVPASSADWGGDPIVTPAGR